MNNNKNGWDWSTGEKTHYKDGVVHCEAGPAVFPNNEYAGPQYWLNGTMFPKDIFEIAVEKQSGHFESRSGAHYFLKEGVLDREDGPALITRLGKASWFNSGLLIKEEKINMDTDILIFDKWTGQHTKTLAEENAEFSANFSAGLKAKSKM